MNKLRLQDVPVKGKKVLIRVDFNVPFNPDGSIADDTRIKEALPTIQYVLQEGGSVILMSHLGRPKGKADPEFSLLPCAKHLSKLLHQNVVFATDCIGPEPQEKAKNLKPKDVLLLENLRFYTAEEKPEADPSFAQKLASLGDIYVNDAFGAAHRKHASTCTIASYFPNKAVAGLLMQKEMAFLMPLALKPKRPFYAIIGGAKISSKMGVLQALTSKVDAIFLGGGMTYTLLKTEGIPIGNSIYEEDQIEIAKKFIAGCKEKKIPLHLPVDLVIADAFKEGAHSKIISAKEGIPPHWQGMDIGPKTIQEWTPLFNQAATIFWNGPLGVFEFPQFAKGTAAVAKALAQLQGKTTTIVGGGDSISAINSLNLSQKFSHLSTGGGASLELIEFGHLPGIDALSPSSS